MRGPGAYNGRFNGLLPTVPAGHSSRNFAAMNISVPLLDLRAQYASIRDEIDAAIERVVSSQVCIYGPELAAFEVEIATYCEAGHAIGCASGSDARSR